MADNKTFQTATLATLPNATVVATDEIVGVDYQKIKLVDGTADSTQVIAAGGGVEAGALRVTVASDSTGVLSVDDNGGSLTVDGTVTIDDGGGSITVDGTVGVSGTVTVDSELTTDDFDTGAGTDTIAKVGLAFAASGGSTKVSAAAPLPVTVISGASNTQYAEDAAHASGDIGTVALARRADTASVSSGTDGDYSTLNVDANGRLHVKQPDGASVAASNETSTVYNGATALTPKFAVVNLSSTGTVIAAVASKKIRVLAVQAVASAGVTSVTWKSGAGGTALTGPQTWGAAGGTVLPYNPVGWFETASNTLLELSFTGTATLGGSITYVEV